MGTIWIVVADAGRAMILSKTDDEKMNLVQQLENPLGRVHNVGLINDFSGRLEKHGSNMRSAMNPPTNPHEEKAKEFARELNRVVHAAAREDKFESLVIIAPAHFLGLLRNGMQAASKRRVISEQAKDLMRLSLAELESRLCNVLHDAQAAVVG